MIDCAHAHNYNYTRLGVLWRSLTPPSKIRKGSVEPCIIDLCHKQNSGSSNQIYERNSYIIFVTSLQHARNMAEESIRCQQGFPPVYTWAVVRQSQDRRKIVYALGLNGSLSPHGCCWGSRRNEW